MSVMVIRLTAESRACLLDSSRPGSLVHDVLAGSPVVTRPGDPRGGLYEIECSDTDCEELLRLAAEFCPEAVPEITAAVGQNNRDS